MLKDGQILEVGQRVEYSSFLGWIDFFDGYSGVIRKTRDLGSGLVQYWVEFDEDGLSGWCFPADLILLPD